MGQSRVTDDQLREAARSAANLRQLLEAVGLVGRGANYALYRARLLRIGVADERFQRRPPARPVPPEALVQAAAAARSVAGTCRALGLPADGRAARRVTRSLQELGVDTSHFVGQGWRRGATSPPRTARPLSELLQEGSRIRSSALKARLLRDGLLAAVCSGCGGTTWRGRAMPLELDHVNGVRDDNRLENLRLLCPDCHALTDTYRGRNIGRPSYAAVEPP